MVSVSVALPPALSVAEDGETEHVNPDGSPEHVAELKSTVPLKPFTETTEKESVPELEELASVTYGFTDDRMKPGVADTLPSKFPTLTDPRPVVRSYPVPALYASCPLISSTPNGSPPDPVQSGLAGP